MGKKEAQNAIGQFPGEGSALRQSSHLPGPILEGPELSDTTALQAQSQQSNQDKFIVTNAG